MKSLLAIAVLCISVLFMSFSAYAAEAQYVGVGKCKSCHRKPKMGNAIKAWEKTKHADSYKTLLTKDAKKDAKKMGLSKPPEESYECLVCHATAPEAPKSKFAPTFKIEEGIGCESCHGPGSKYKKKKIMKSLREEYDAGGNELAQKYEYDHGSEKTCADRCHRPEITIDGVTFKNNFYKELDIKEGMEKIAHPMPDQ